MENKGKYLKYALHAAILIGLIWAAVNYVNGEEVLEVLQSFQYRFLPLMLALAAVAIYRIVTIVFPALPGALVYFLFWRGEEEMHIRQEMKAKELKASHAGNPDL